MARSSKKIPEATKASLDAEFNQGMTPKEAATIVEIEVGDITQVPPKYFTDPTVRSAINKLVKKEFVGTTKPIPSGFIAKYRSSFWADDGDLMPIGGAPNPAPIWFGWVVLAVIFVIGVLIGIWL